MTETPPQNPAGTLETHAVLTPDQRTVLIAEIEQAPARLRETVAGLSESQIDTRYRNWTIRQIVHHLADSHINAYVRFKWTLTEDQPTIKPYHEGEWSELSDVKTGDIALPLALMDALHRQWVQLLRAMSPEQFQRTYLHPEMEGPVTLDAALCTYAWHGQHHTAQIQWLRDHMF